MRSRAILLTVTLAITSLLAPLGASWGNDALQEPSSARYDTQRYMWQTANDAGQLGPTGLRDRIYFNVQISTSFATKHTNVFVPFAGQVGLDSPTGRLAPPTLLHADALLGYWRDCNNDGYVGNGLTGQKTYLASSSITPIDERVCPLGTAFNDDQCVLPPPPGANVPGSPGPNNCLAPNAPYNQVKRLFHEFVDIGDDGRYRLQNNLGSWRVDDPTARVWGDLGLPGTERVRYFTFRDMIAENPPQLFFAPGTFDSSDGFMGQVDLLTFGEMSRLAREQAGVDLYALPVEDEVATGLHVVRYNGYSAGNDENAWNGEPMVQVWECSDPQATPVLQPEVNPDGSLGDSVNESIRGVSVYQTNPANGAVIADVQVSSGCADYNQDAIFHEGLFLPHAEDETMSVSALKDTVDMYFQYRPPLNEPRNQLAAWGIVPRADRTTGGTWYAHQLFVNDGVDLRKTNWFTFYASVGPAAIGTTVVPAGGLSALPAGTSDIGVYGAEYCVGQATPNPFKWNCNAAAWAPFVHPEWGVPLGQRYDLRDVDCMDFTPVEDASWATARALVNQVAVDTTSESVFQPDCA